MKRLGWKAKKKELHTDTLLLSLVISRLGRSEDKNILAKARKKFSVMQKGDFNVY